MSYSAFAAPLRLELHPSRRLRRWRQLVYASVALSLTQLQSPLLTVLTAGLLVATLLRSSGTTPSVLLWHSTGHWDLNVEGQRLTADLAHPAFVQAWLVILPLRCQGRRRIQHVVILPDMLPTQAFRRLRVRLRMAGHGFAEPTA